MWRHSSRVKGRITRVANSTLVNLFSASLITRPFYFQVKAFTFVIRNWKINRIHDGFRFFRNKAASLQARVSRIQAGLEPLTGSTPPETPRWMMSPAASPAGTAASRRRSATHGSSGSLRDGMTSPSQDSVSSLMLKTAMQNEAYRSGTSTPQSTPDITPRSP